MPKHPFLFAAGIMLAAASSAAADYKCIDEKMSARIQQHDISIKDREAAVAEMRTEIKDGGGATDQQKKALTGFEEKLASAKTAREELLKLCNAQ